MELLSTLSNVMKNHYLPEVPEMFNNNLFLYKMLEKTNRFMQGKEIIIPMQVAENERGVGPRGEQGALPIAGKNEYTQSKTGIKYHYGVVSLSNQALKLTTSPETLVMELKRATDGTMNAFYNDWNRQAWGDSTGLLGTVGTLGTLKFPLATAKDIYNFRRGMYLEFYTTTTPVTAPTAGFYVTDINYGTYTITLNSITGLTAGDVIYREGSSYVDTTVKTHEMQGMGNFVSATNTLQDIDRSAQSYWQAYLSDAGTSETVTDNIIMTWLDAQDQIVGSEKMIDCILMNYGMRRAIDVMMKTAHTPIETFPSEAGFGDAFVYNYGGNKIAMKMDKNAWTGSLVGITTKNMFIAEGAPLEWRNGGALTEREGFDSVWTDFSWYCNLITDKGNSFTKLFDLAEA